MIVDLLFIFLGAWAVYEVGKIVAENWRTRSRHLGLRGKRLPDGSFEWRKD